MCSNRIESLPFASESTLFNFLDFSFGQLVGMFYSSRALAAPLNEWIVQLDWPAFLVTRLVGNGFSVVTHLDSTSTDIALSAHDPIRYTYPRLLAYGLFSVEKWKMFT